MVPPCETERTPWEDSGQRAGLAHRHRPATDHRHWHGRL